MPTMSQILGKATVKLVKKAVYVPYCEHTKKPGDRCEHHCRPSKEFLQWKAEMEQAQKRAKEYKRLQDPVERLCDAIFGPTE